MSIFYALANKFKSFKSPSQINYKPYLTGTIVSARYSNAKKDPSPLILVLYSGICHTRLRGKVHLTHSININALNGYQKRFLLKLIISLYKQTFPVDLKTLYLYIKYTDYSVIKAGYRTYFTAYLSGKEVSPGFFKAPIPISNLINPFVVALNKEIMGVDFVRQNIIRGKDNIKQVIEKMDENNMTPNQSNKPNKIINP